MSNIEPDSSKQIPLEVDTAKTKISEDEFYRARYAEKFAQLLIGLPMDASFTAAIEGGWGTGKTTVLNFITGTLESEFKVVRFNPWEIADPKMTVVRFFSKIISGSNLDLSQAWAIPADAWKKLREMATAESIVDYSEGGKAKAIASLLLGDPSERKERLAAKLKDKEIRVLVVIDDIDRLPPSEIQLVFRIVGAIGKIPGVSYLLSYDKIPVVNALGFGATLDGEAYLNKLVQHASRLPSISHQTMHSVAMSRVAPVLDHPNFPASYKDFETARLERIFASPFFIKLVKTPRRLGRVISQAVSMFFQLEAHVSFTDLLVLEIIRAESDKFFEALLEMEVRSMEIVWGAEEKEKVFKILNESKPASQTQEAMSDACEFVFAGLNTYVQEKFEHFGESTPYRLREVNTWRRFQFQADDASSISFEAMDQIAGTRPEEMRKALQKVLSNNHLFGLFRMLNTRQELDVKSPSLLGEMLFNDFAALASKSNEFRIYYNRDIIRSFLGEQDEAFLEEFFSYSLKPGNPVTLSMILLRGLSRKNGTRKVFDGILNRIKLDPAVIYLPYEDWHEILHCVHEFKESQSVVELLEAFPTELAWITKNAPHLSAVLHNAVCIPYSAKFKEKLEDACKPMNTRPPFLAAESEKPPFGEKPRASNEPIETENEKDMGGQ